MENFWIFWISRKLTSILQKFFGAVKQKLEVEILKLHNIRDKCPKKKKEEEEEKKEETKYTLAFHAEGKKRVFSRQSKNVDNPTNLKL